VGLFLQPWNPHGADGLMEMAVQTTGDNDRNSSDAQKSSQIITTKKPELRRFTSWISFLLPNQQYQDTQQQQGTYILQ